MKNKSSKKHLLNKKQQTLSLTNNTRQLLSQIQNIVCGENRSCALISSSLISAVAPLINNTHFHSFPLVKLLQFLLLNPSSDHHTQYQSYSTGSSKLTSSSFFGSHFQSSKRFVLLGLVSLDDNNKLQRHNYSSHRSKVLYSLSLCVLKILLIFGGGGRFFYQGKASAED